MTMTLKATVRTQQSDDPGAKGVANLLQAEAVQTCLDVYGGTFTMRDAGTKYLPQHPKEEEDAYSDRKNRAKLFNAFRRTVKGVTGLVFRKDPTIGDDVDTRIAEHLDNVDLTGRDLATFAKALFKSKTKLGHALILVDWHGPGGARRRADETEARPYWTLIEKDQVLRFRTRQEDGKTILTSIAWLESDIVEDGEFTEKLVLRVRQLDLVEEGAVPRVEYRSWIRDADKKDDWEPEEAGTPLGERMTRIPIAVDYADRTGFLMSEPPLLDLALENVEHWRVRSERAQTLGIAGIPIFTIIGDVNKNDIGTFTVGASIGLLLPEGAEAKYVETTGAALEESRQELQDIEQRMAALGLSMLVRKSNRPQTAEAERLNRSEQDSELADSARGTQNALAEALVLHAMWMGLDATVAGTVGVNTDFELGQLDAQTIREFRELWMEAGISWETLVAILLRGETLPEGFDADEERERIETEAARRMDADPMIQSLRQAAGEDDGVGDAEGDEEGEAA